VYTIGQKNYRKSIHQDIIQEWGITQLCSIYSYRAIAYICFLFGK